MATNAWRSVSRGRPAAFACVALLIVDAGALSVLAIPASQTRHPSDPLAAEIARWSRYLETHRSDDEMWSQVKAAMEPVLAQAGAALRGGHRLLALQRLASAWPNLAGSVYLDGRPTALREDEAAFEAEWKRVGVTMRADVAPPRGDSFDGVSPAAVRAMGEASLPQVRAFYESAIEYARSTKPAFGLFYIGAAQAQRDFAKFCRTLYEKTDGPAPSVRPLDRELDALETDLLSLYRPPVSIDRHGEFIGASAALKEARELDAAGLRYGALLRYLGAVQRAAALRPAAAPPDRTETARRLAAFENRLDGGDVDHSIGRLFLESAQADLAATAGDAALASAVASDVLPRYFAALAPAVPAPKKPAALATVTLVRWPYT